MLGSKRSISYKLKQIILIRINSIWKHFLIKYLWGKKIFMVLYSVENINYTLYSWLRQQMWDLFIYILKEELFWWKYLLCFKSLHRLKQLNIFIKYPLATISVDKIDTFINENMYIKNKSKYWSYFMSYFKYDIKI